MTKRITLLLSTLLISTLLYSQKSDDFFKNSRMDTNIVYGKLDNGLTYYIRHNEEPKNRANFYIAQRVGSVQEDDGQEGLAHFLEHMCFNGTEHFPGDSIIKYCESIGVKFGANLNAYTSTDETVYNINDVPVTKGNVDSCLLILSDWAGRLLLHDEEIDKERGVIHEEWRMRTSAFMRMINRNLPTLYPNSKYAHRMPIGLMSVVDNFAPDTLRAYYKKWYRPDLQAIIVVGDIDTKEVENKIKELFGNYKVPENAAKLERYPVPYTPAIVVVDKDKEFKVSQISLMFKWDNDLLGQKEPYLYFTTEYSKTLVCNAINARFAELSRNPDCPFISCSCYYDNYLISKTMDAFEVDIEIKEGKHYEAVELVSTELARVFQHGITHTELARAREEFKNNYLRLYNNRDKQKNSYYVRKCLNHFLNNDPLPSIEDEYEYFNIVAEKWPDDGISVISKISVNSIDTNFVMLALFPEKESLELPTADSLYSIIKKTRAIKLEPYIDNVKEEPLVNKLPKRGKIVKEEQADFGYTKWTLSNGARVFFRHTDFHNTDVMFDAVSHGGTATLQSSDIINAKLFNIVMSMTGVGNFTNSELQKKLAGKHASVHSGISNYYDQIGGNCQKKDMQTMFELLYLQFQPTISDVDGYESCINMIRTALQNRSNDPMAAFNDSITKTIYNDNPFTRQITLDDLSKADYNKILQIRSDRFKSAGDFDFFFTGAFNVDSLRNFVEQYIASQPKVKKREPKCETKLYEINKGVTTNRFERKMETPMAYLCQIWNGDNSLTLKNNVNVKAVESVLRARYLKSIREDNGFAYSVSVSANISSGITDEFIVEISCPFTPSKCDSVLTLIAKDLADIKANGVKESELTSFKEFQLKNYADQQRNNSYWQSQIKNKVLHNADLHTNFEEYVKNLSSDDIKSYISTVVLEQNNCTTVIMLPDDFTENH